MNQYTGFANEYERFMDNIPYGEWADKITELLKKYGISDGLVCELGCGTGSMTRELKKRGYDMIGIDSSEDMLQIAMYEHFEESQGILYLNQDMREFELYGTVSAVVSVCDSMNYLTEEEDLVKTFKLVNNYLEKDGIFIFDMKTEYEFKNGMGNRVITDNREDACLIWENSYDEQNKLNRYDITVFSETGKNGLFERTTEIHLQRAYEADRIKQLLEKAGLEFVAAAEAYSGAEPADSSERLYFIAREKRQDGKLYV